MALWFPDRLPILSAAERFSARSLSTRLRAPISYIIGDNRGKLVSAPLLDHGLTKGMYCTAQATKHSTLSYV